jgi:hypothetical protein
MTGKKKRRQIHHVRNTDRNRDRYFAGHGKFSTRRLSGMGGLPAVAASDKRQWLNLAAGYLLSWTTQKSPRRKETWLISIRVD